MFLIRGGRAMPCGAAGQSLASRCCWRLSFVEGVAGCEPRARTIDVHRCITAIIIATASISAILMSCLRIRMIVIGERAIDLKCIWQVLDGRTKPCAVRSVMAGRSLDTVRSLGWQDEALRGTLRDVRAQLRSKPNLYEIIVTTRRLLRAQRRGSATRRLCQ